MATTTNFGWQTPDDTDLVKDGAAAIRTLGSSIDTSLVDLKGGTTGQILAKTSNTDMDFTWVANDVGDITEVTVSSPLTGGGSSGSVNVAIQDGTTAQKGAVQLEDSTSSTSTTKAATPNSVKSAYDLADAAIPESLVDAKGDLLTATADNTPARLAVGNNGETLVADSSTSTGLKWESPNGPAFRAYRTTSAQSFSANTWSKVQLNGESYDTASCFDSTTNYRFTPNKAGYYQFNGASNNQRSGSGLLYGAIYKNGAGAAVTGYQIGSNDTFSPVVNDIIYMNGTTDYVELYVYDQAATSRSIVQSAVGDISYFSGVWIRS